ncbi:hypothetical protein DOTSEDRAFT_68684 [Dothistroma septosporum NZE10]|uniref:Uncharacterized protein n=1 Tax=Dothistroma septosporum (strain NZE10 / CBS 128990) TaxID=675120 RepID=N1Q526_DOTSN|nr:hypothetical protein DOTSEDRAFT_68684 [Dothistroma septosporum NZE10]
MRRSSAATGTKRGSESYNDAGADVCPISYPCPTDPEPSGPGTLHLSHWLATASCMDLRPQSRHEQYRDRLHCHNNSLYLPYSKSKQARPASYTGPLTRSEWSDVPLPYRPRDWQDAKDEPFPATIQEPHRWRLRPFVDGENQSSAQSRGRRRPDAVKSITARDYHQQQRPDADPAVLYPQMSPYNDAASSYSAPDDLGLAPRAVSQPNNTSSYWQTPHHASDGDDGSALTMIPRIPTYPPAGRRRTRAVANSAEATFTDEEEFHLFVQATAGLGPEQAFRDLNSPEESPRRSRTRASRTFSTPQAPPSNELVSPVQETPTTIHALQQLAQMPRDPRLHAPARLGAGQSFAAQRLDTALGGIDLWLQPPSAVSEQDDGVVSPIDDDDDDDDELPNYAASQAQAHAAQRAEATRRAQELQMRWQLRTG